MQHGEAGRYGLRYVCRHGAVGVHVDSEVTNGCSWRNVTSVVGYMVAQKNWHTLFYTP